MSRQIRTALVCTIVLVLFCMQLHASAQKPGLQLQLGWPRDVLAQGWIDNGNSFVTISNANDGLVIWDPKTWQIKSTVPSPLKTEARSVNLCSNGRYAAMDNDRGQVSILTIPENRKLFDITSSSYHFSPDSRFLISSGDNSVQFWDLSSGTLARAIKFPDEPNPYAIISPDNRLLLVGGNKLTVRDAHTGRILCKLKESNSRIMTPFAFSPDGKLLATCGEEPGWEEPSFAVMPEDGFDNLAYIRTFRLQLWDTRTGKRIWSIPERKANWPANSLQFIDNGHKIVCCGNIHDGSKVKVWDVATGKLVSSHTSSTKNLAYAISPDHSAIAIGSEFYSLPHLTKIRSIPISQAHARDISISPDSKKLAVTGLQKTVTIWGMTGPGVTRVIRPSDKIDRIDRGIFFLLDSDTLAVSNLVFTELWSTTNGQMLRRIGPQSIPEQDIAPFQLSPDGHILVGWTFQGKGVLHIWDAATGKETRSFESGGDLGSISDFSPDSRWFATSGSSWDTYLNLYDLVSGTYSEPKDLNNNHEVLVRNYSSRTSFSSDSRMLVSVKPVNDQFQWIIWDIENKRVVTTIESGRQPYCSAFSPDGQLLVTSQDHNAAIHRVKDGSLVCPLELTSVVKEIRYDPSGRFIIGCGHAGVQFWDAKTGKLALTLISEPPQANGKGGFWIAYTPDGYYTGSAGIEQRITWRVGDKLLPGKIYAQEFHRPDIIHSLVAGIH